MIIFYLIIIILTIYLYYIIKDISKLLRITSIITISSGYLTILIGYIETTFIKNKIDFINISKVTNLLFDKNVSKGLILILIGAIELIIIIILDTYKRYIKT